MKRITFAVEGFRAVVLVAGALLAAGAAGRAAEPAGAADVEKLERRLRGLEKQVAELKQKQARPGQGAEGPERLKLGGYGEIHYNAEREDGQAGDKIDLHRLVFYVGYEFADWIRLHSEIEVEHAFVSDGDGEISIEQLYVDLHLDERLNVRVGRVLAPLGIINRDHEPTLFNGVERPAFARYVIPSTWSLDGVGLFGRLLPGLSYEAYLSSSLDGSGFSATGGIRDGRMKESPGMSEPALSARLDYFPLLGRELPGDQELRLGVSFFHGGLNNGNDGNNPELDADLTIYSADFEYSVWKLDFRGAFAWEKIGGARNIGGGVASDIVGFYFESALHAWPDEWKRGKLAESDAVLFVRYDNFDTQHEVPSGVVADQTADRQEITVGVSFFPVKNLVFKLDYQFRDDATAAEVPDRFNLGVGWRF